MGWIGRILLRRGSPETVLGKADAALAAGDLETTLDAVDIALEKLRGSRTRADKRLRGRAWQLRAQVHIATGAEDDAVEALKTAHELVPLTPTELVLVAKRLVADGTRDARVLAEVLAFCPDDAAAAALEPDIRRLSRPGAFPADALDACAEWNEALAKRAGDLAWPWLHVGVSRARAGRHDRAAQAFSRACRSDPTSGPAHLGLAASLVALGRGDDTDAALDVAVECGGSDAALGLRAWRRRENGDVEGAAEDARQIRSPGSLPSGVRLACAEALASSGDVNRVERFLADGLDREPEAILVSARSYAAAGQPGEAARRLSRALPNAALGAAAARELVALATRFPEDAGVLRVLREVRNAHKDVAFHAAHVRAVLLQDGPADALQALPSSSLRGSIIDLGNLTFAAGAVFTALHAAGEDETIVRAACGHASQWIQADPAVRVVKASLVRLASGALVRGAASVDDAMRLLEDTRHAHPDIAGDPVVRLAYGLLAAAKGRVDVCERELSGLDDDTTSHPEVRLQRLRAALAGHDVGLARRLEADDTSARARRVGVARAALLGEREAFASGVAELDDEPAAHDLSIAVSALGGDPGVLDDARSPAYWRVVAAVRAGRPDVADAVLAAAGDDEVTPDERGALGAALALARARAALREGRVDDAIGRLEGALEGDAVLPPLVAERAEHALLRRSIESRDSDRLAARIADAARRLPPGDVGTEHRRLLLELASMGRAEAAGEPSAMVLHAERAIASACVVLVAPDYLERFAALRFHAYGAKAGSDATAMADAIERRLERILSATQGRLRQVDDGAGAARFERLVLALRAELLAARLLAEVGGLPLAGRRLSAGPTWLALHGHAPAFGAWLAGRAQPETADLADRLLARAKAREAGEPDEEQVLESETIDQLERLFSQLRFATLRRHEKQPQAAFDELKSSPIDCLPLGSGRRCGCSAPAACRDAPERFGTCNPAFAADDGPARLQDAGRRLTAFLLADLGEAAFIEESPDLPKVRVRFEQALRLVEDTPDQSVLEERMRVLGLGRAKALTSQGRLDDAVAVLECIEDACGDEITRAQLGQALAQMAVKIANETKDWRTSADVLRRARARHSESVYVNRNLVICLQWLGEELAAEDVEQARAVLREALEVAQGMIRSGFDDPNTRALVNGINSQLADLMLKGGSGDVSKFLELISGDEAESAPASRAAEHLERGKRQMDDRHYDAAVRSFERALEADPSSTAAVSGLVEALLGRAQRLHGSGEQGGALADLRRIAELRPGHEEARNLRQEIETK